MASIYRNGTRWRASVKLPNGKRSTRMFDQKADANAWAATVEADTIRGDWTDPRAGRRLLGDYVTEWAAVQRWRPSTRGTVNSKLNRWILPTFGDRPLGSITNSEIRGFVGKLEDAGLAPASVELTYRYLVSILESAIADRLIVVNPATVRRIPLPQKPPRDASDLVVITPADVIRLADAVPERLRAFVWCGAAAGLRPGETAGLTVEALNLPRREFTIDRQMAVSPGRLELGPPKTRASIRTVPIPDELVTELSRHLEQFPAVDTPDPATGGTRSLIFTNRDGRPLRRTVLSDNWHRYAHDRAGLPAEARGWHSLRHFYASALIAAGESIKTVQARMGHATANETLNVYAALWPTADDQTRSAISGIFSTDEAEVGT